MAVETLGEAFSQGWRVTVRCALGPEDGAHSKSSRRCIGRSREVTYSPLHEQSEFLSTKQALVAGEVSPRLALFQGMR